MNSKNLDKPKYEPQSFKSSLISSFSLVIGSLLFFYLFVFWGWEVHLKLPFLKYGYFLYSFLSITLLLVICRFALLKYTFYIMFKVITLVIVIVTLLMGCGGVWFLIFKTLHAVIASILILALVIVLLASRLSKLSTFNINKRFKHYHLFDDFNDAYKLKSGALKISALLCEIDDYYSNEFYNRIYDFLFSIGSVLSIVLLGLTMSLDRLGLELSAMIFINVLFYIIFIFFSLSNTIVSNLSLYRSIFVYSKREGGLTL